MPTHGKCRATDRSALRRMSIVRTCSRRRCRGDRARHRRGPGRPSSSVRPDVAADRPRALTAPAASRPGRTASIAAPLVREGIRCRRAEAAAPTRRAADRRSRPRLHPQAAGLRTRHRPGAARNRRRRHHHILRPQAGARSRPRRAGRGPPKPPGRGPEPRGVALSTRMLRPSRLVLFRAPSARSASSEVAISTKPKPRDRPVSRSVMTAADSTTPYRAKAARRLSFEVVKDRPPTNSFTDIGTLLSCDPSSDDAGFRMTSMSIPSARRSGASFGRARRRCPPRSRQQPGGHRGARMTPKRTRRGNFSILLCPGAGSGPTESAGESSANEHARGTISRTAVAWHSTCL